MAPPVYLDYAATAAVRPPEVAEAVAAYLRDVGATPGRAAHRLSLDAGRLVLRCRRRLAELLGAPGDPGRVVFAPSATYALNTALFGILEPGDTVVRTAYDHNAVRRPVAVLRGRGVQEVVLTGRADGSLDLDEAERALAGAGGARGGRYPRRPARLLVLPHVSNVLGTASPVAQLAELARACGTLVLVDAAQSAGHVPIDVERLGVDLLAFTGHKGLLGPQGTGGLWVRPGVEVRPLVFGGAGGDSADEAMPAALPDRLEPGTPNAPGIAGLLAGVDWLCREGVDRLHRRLTELKGRLRAGLRGIPGVTLHSPADAGGAPIVTMTLQGRDAAELARLLDDRFGVLTRAGLHCAPETHAVLGTTRGGAVRFSLGWASGPADVQRAVDAVRALAGNGEPPPAVHPGGS